MGPQGTYITRVALALQRGTGKSANPFRIPTDTTFFDQDGADGWKHPIHIHLIDFQIISRNGVARNKVLDYEKVALKDVVWLNTSEQAKVIARYAPWDGSYMVSVRL